MIDASKSRIFRGENFELNQIELASHQRKLANSTSRILMEKINNKFQFLIYNKYNNYISIEFIYYYIINDIILILLFSYFLYLI